MTVTIPEVISERLRAEVARHPYPLVFATISGAHLYGFPSPDSDYDLRGTHILPVAEVVGLDPGQETVQFEMKDDVLELDLVTPDVKKFFAVRGTTPQAVSTDFAFGLRLSRGQDWPHQSNPKLFNCSRNRATSQTLNAR